MLSPWTPALFVKYLLAIFPIINNKVDVEGQKKYDATKKSETTHALRSLHLSKKKWSGDVGDLIEVRYALEVLRGRESRVS